MVMPATKTLNRYTPTVHWSCPSTATSRAIRGALKRQARLLIPSVRRVQLGSEPLPLQKICSENR